MYVWPEIKTVEETQLALNSSPELFAHWGTPCDTNVAREVKYLVLIGTYRQIGIGAGKKDGWEFEKAVTPNIRWLYSFWKLASN